MQRVVAPFLPPLRADTSQICFTAKITRPCEGTINQKLFAQSAKGREDSRERERERALSFEWCLLHGFYIKEILYWYWGMGTVL